VNDLWVTEEDIELIERSLKQANLPPTITVKPLLKEIRRIYMPTTLEARNYCEPFQEFREYLTKKYGHKEYSLIEAFSILQGEFAEKHKNLYIDIMHCVFFNYCITIGLGQILCSNFKPDHLFLLLPNPPTFGSRGITFQRPLEVEGKKIAVSLIHFKGTETYKTRLLIHELGHQLGVSSCSNKNCVMSVCDFIDEYATSLPVKFCDACKRKIEEHIFS